MDRIRMSLRGLVAAIVVSAMAFAALRASAEVFFDVFYTATAAMLLVAMLLAFASNRATRVFWIGFAVFGWFCFLQGAMPEATRVSHYVIGGEVYLNQHLLTSRALKPLVGYVRRMTTELEQIRRITDLSLGVLHLLATWFIGVFGGVIASWIEGRRRESKTRGIGQAACLGTATVLAYATLVAANGSRPAPSDFFPESPILAGDTDPPTSPERYATLLAEAWERLGRMGEPSAWKLSRTEPHATSYRVLWIPEGGHPICARIDRIDGGANLRCVVLDSTLEGYSGGIAINHLVELDDVAWEELTKRVDESLLWEMPVSIAAERPGGQEGDRLFVEGVMAGRYHLVARKELNPDFDELLRYLLQLTGLNLADTRWAEELDRGFR